jgi:hypothetical protein
LVRQTLKVKKRDFFLVALPVKTPNIILGRRFNNDSPYYFGLNLSNLPFSSGESNIVGPHTNGQEKVLLQRTKNDICQ